MKNYQFIVKERLCAPRNNSKRYNDISIRGILSLGVNQINSFSNEAQRLRQLMQPYDNYVYFEAYTL